MMGGFTENGDGLDTKWYRCVVVVTTSYYSLPMTSKGRANHDRQYIRFRRKTGKQPAPSTPSMGFQCFTGSTEQTRSSTNMNKSHSYII